MQTTNEFTKAKYSEWLASLFGACLVAFALGIWLYDYLGVVAWPAFIIGIALHSWGMYKTYQRNK